MKPGYRALGRRLRVALEFALPDERPLLQEDEVEDSGEFLLRR